MPTSETNPERRPVSPTQRASRALRRAERLAERGHVTEAIHTLEQAISYGADRFPCYLQLARLYQTRRQWHEAVSAAEKAVAEQPHSLSAREAVIALYLESGEYARAVDASRSLLQISPRHLPARDALGAAYIGLGEVDAALRVANDLIRLDPTDAAHRFKKALLCQHRGEVRIAVEEFQRVLVMAPGTDLAQSAREQLDILDWFQIDTIMTLAAEDMIFRAKLLRDPDQAAAERGFCLSDTSRQRLHEIAVDDLPPLEGDGKAKLYH